MAAHTIFTNCQAYTLDAANTTASAIAVENGIIARVGSIEYVETLGGHETQWVDMAGKTVVPGLIDAHNHLVFHGVSATRSTDLTGCRSVGEVQERLRAFREHNPDAPWILGQRFDQELFAEGRWPTRADLDAVSTDVPVMITRVCLHALVSNSAALAPIEGKLSAAQNKSGLLTEDATLLVWERIPPPTESELENAILWACNQARRAGLSGVHCMIDSIQEVHVLQRLHAQNRLPVRLRLQCPVEVMDLVAAEGMKFMSGDDWLRIGSVKLYMDGSMGARTAAMREPFADELGASGELMRSETELAQLLRHIQRGGFQASIHAIGDLAIETALRGIEMAMDDGNPGNILRHRIEHATQMGDDLVRNMARLRVPAVVQPQFIITDFWTCDRVGAQRYRWSYPFKTMLNAGIHLAMGSDCPVERLDAIELIDRAINREPRSLTERLSVEETLRAYTLGGAYVGFDERIKGTLEQGKLADFVVLSDDPFTMAPSRIGDIRVQNVAIGGQLL